MKIAKTVKGLALGTSLAAFASFAVPATSQASELFANEQIGSAPAKTVDDKPETPAPKKDAKKKKGGEKSCGGAEGSCGGKK